MITGFLSPSFTSKVALDQSGNNDRIIEFKQNVLTCKINAHILIHIAGKDLAYFIQCLTGYDHFLVIIRILKQYPSDRDPVAVKRNHLQRIVTDLE